jgi:hypothetical protein
MQCYFMKGGHIVLVKELPTDLSDEEAVEQCRLAFEGRREYLDDFEVWQRTRKVYRHSLDREAFAFSLKRAVWP